MVYVDDGIFLGSEDPQLQEVIKEDPGPRPWFGNPLGIPRNSAIISILDLLYFRIFIGILFFQS
jgi:hypothetical protein